jgi:transcription antitermination protein NusB
MEEKRSKKSGRGSRKARALSARLAAVQAVYQRKINKKPLAAVIEEYINYRAGEPVDGDEMLAPDSEFFEHIVKGVDDSRPLLEDVITRILDERETEQGLEPLLMSIMLCGAYELSEPSGIDAAIIISDYLHVTHAFYDQGEHKLVNAVLDSIKTHSQEGVVL